MLNYLICCVTAINVTERTAEVGKDVSRQFAKQVQFNPGMPLLTFTGHDGSVSL